VLVKWWLLAIPHYLIVGVFAGGAWAGVNAANDHWGWSSGGGLIGLLALATVAVITVVSLVITVFGLWTGGRKTFDETFWSSLMHAIGLYLIARSPKQVAVGVFVLPVVLVLVALAGIWAPRDDWAAWGGMTYFWGVTHGLFYLVGAVGSCLAFAAGLMYLLQSSRLKHKRPTRFGFALPSLEQSERLNRAGITVAFPFLTAGLVIGFYDGIAGPGTGSFLVFTLVGLLGYAFLEASAKAKIANVATNVGALIVFVPQHAVLWSLGLLMGVANLGGGLLGARTAVARGSSFVRVVFLLVVGALIVRLGYDVVTELAR